MINNINLIGRITRDLEVKRNEKGTAICSFTLAVNSRRKDEKGEYLTNFIPCVAFNKTAETLEKYCKKGSLIGVNGSLEVKRYQKKDGSNGTSMSVAVREIEFCNTKKADEEIELPDNDIIDDSDISEAELPF